MQVMTKPVIGVMGASENDALSETEKVRLKDLAEKLGSAVAKHDCILISGATTGLPDLISRSARRHGGFALGISPAENRREHLDRYKMPPDAADVIIYTGFGLKGRNVINVRSADIVIIFGGATGTLNEFTIAYDEGKIIGVLADSGGVADHIKEIIEFCKKPTRGVVVYDADPETLIENCLRSLQSRDAKKAES
jgi:uncharacterized protein (TIGR00725 family)